MSARPGAYPRYRTPGTSNCRSWLRMTELVLSSVFVTWVLRCPLQVTRPKIAATSVLLRTVILSYEPAMRRVYLGR
jgi:hypothetical protein